MRRENTHETNENTEGFFFFLKNRSYKEESNGEFSTEKFNIQNENPALRGAS